MYVLLKIKQVTFLNTNMSLCKAVRYVNRGYMSKEGKQVMLAPFFIAAYTVYFKAKNIYYL